MSVEDKREAYQVGVFVFILLAVLTVGEFAISTVAVGWWGPLVVIAVIKAILIIREYMHVGRLFSEDPEQG